MSDHATASPSAKVFIGRTGSDLDAQLLAGLQATDWESIVTPGARVAIKPNHCWPEILPGVTTTPAVLDALLAHLVTRTDRISIVESDGISYSAESAFDAHGTPALAAKHRAQIVNLSRKRPVNRRVTVAGRSLEIEVPAFLIDEIDVLITMPVLKTHVITEISLGMKNLWGCLPDSMRVLKHHQLAHGIVALSMELKPRLTVIDATFGLDKRGPVFGEAVDVGKIVVSNSVVAADVVGSHVLGFDPRQIEHLRLAEESGLGSLDLTSIELSGEGIDVGHRFSVEPTLVDKLSNLSYKSAFATKLIHGSPLSKPIYAVTRKTIPVPNRDLIPAG
jgi:uncharacterized protein (DUF362 family)